MGVDPKVCYWECAEANDCVIGGFECKGCGEHFCSLFIDEIGLCNECRKDEEIGRMQGKDCEMSENETVADIIAEMRSGVLSATIECEACGEEQEQRFRFDGLAARIETAWRRERELGNAAAIREALWSIYLDAQFICDYSEEPSIVRHRADSIERRVNSVLSSPQSISEENTKRGALFTEAAENVNSESVIDTHENNAAANGPEILVDEVEGA